MCRFLLQASTSSEHLSIVVPVLVARLGQTEIVEPSEEVRLSLMGFITELIKFFATGMAPFVGDVVLILQQTICDPYPEVKKVGNIFSFFDLLKYCAVCIDVLCGPTFTTVLSS